MKLLSNLKLLARLAIPAVVLVVVCADTAEETGAAASQVLGAASELSRQPEQLAAEMSRFLNTVRAA